jgi:hypothetical protein
MFTGIFTLAPSFRRPYHVIYLSVAQTTAHLKEKLVFNGLYFVMEIKPRKYGWSQIPNDKSHHITTGEAAELRTLRPATGLKWIKPLSPFWPRGQRQHTTGGLSWSQSSTPGCTHQVRESQFHAF